MWSLELRKYTLEHFGEYGITFMKSQTPNLYTLGIDRSKPNEMSDNLEKAIKIPEMYRDKEKWPILILTRGMQFLTAYQSVKKMVEDGWAID